MATRKTPKNPEAQPQATEPEPLPAGLDGVVDADTYSRMDDFSREVLLKTATQKVELESKLSDMASTNGQTTATMTALQNQVNQLTAAATATPADPNSLDNYSVDDLMQARQKIDTNRTAAMRALIADPTNEAAAAALEEAEGQNAIAMQIDGELMDRRVASATGALSERLDKDAGLTALQNGFTQEVLVKYGADALNPQSELTKLATEIGNTWSKDNDLSTPEGIQLLGARMAYAEAAKQIEANRAGVDEIIPDLTRRQQAVLPAGGRGTPVSNKIAALQAEGTVQSRGQASRMAIGHVIGKLISGPAAAGAP